MNEESREEFNEYMRGCGFDMDNLKNEAERLALPIAFGAWETQQMVIDELEARAARFKAAFNSL